MIQTQIYEGTPEQLIKQFSRLPASHKYKVVVTSDEPNTAVAPRMITFGMFPQLQSLTEEDIKSAEWHGEDIAF